MSVTPGSFYIFTHRGDVAMPLAVGVSDDNSIDNPVGNRGVTAMELRYSFTKNIIWRLNADKDIYELSCRGGPSFEAAADGRLQVPKLENQIPVVGGKGERWELVPALAGRYFIKSARTGRYWSVPRENSASQGAKSSPPIELQTISSEHFQIFEFRRVPVRAYD